MKQQLKHFSKKFQKHETSLASVAMDYKTTGRFIIHAVANFPFSFKKRRRQHARAT